MGIYLKTENKIERSTIDINNLDLLTKSNAKNQGKWRCHAALQW